MVAVLLSGVMLQVIACALPTAQQSAFGEWSAIWSSDFNAHFHWGDARTWLLSLPGSALLVALIASWRPSWIRSLGLALAGLLPLLVLDQDFAAAASSIATSLAWPSGDEGIALALVLVAGTVAACASSASFPARALVAVAVFVGPVLAFSTGGGSPVDLDLFLAPAHVATDAQVLDLGAHSTWYDARDVGETLGLTVQSSWIQTVAKWLGVICAYGLIFLLPLAALGACLALTVRSSGDLGVGLIALALLAPLGTILSDSLWVWSVPGSSDAVPLALAFNRAASAAHLLSFILLGSGGFAALLHPRARLLSSI